MSIPAERLREGQTIVVRGKVAFSRLAKVIDGEALARSIEQAQKRNQLYPTKVPHTTLNLVDAQVIPADPAAPTIEEQYVHSKIYPVKSGDNQGKPGFSIDNKSTFLPTVLEMDPDAPGQHRQLILDRDLASGMEVQILIDVFKPKAYEKRGLGLQQVVLLEPVRYFSSGTDTAALAARGILVNGGIVSVNSANAGAAEAPATGFPDQFVPANTQLDGSGYAVPAPGAQGTAPLPAAPLGAQLGAPLQAQPLQAQPLQAQPLQAQPLQAQPLAQSPFQGAGQAAPAAPAAPSVPGMSLQDELAMLRQQVGEQGLALSNSGGASAFGDAPAQTEAPVLVGAGAPLSPWEVPAQAAHTYQG